MTKQEEIREGIKDKLEYFRQSDLDNNWQASLILNYLHSQGVVIKVDRELPSITEELERRAHCGQFDDHQWYYAGQGELLEVGCGFFEPLIEEGK